MGSKQKFTIVVAFDTKEDMLAWVDGTFEDNVAAYHGDSSDREFSGSVPGNTFVLRHRGQKPDEFLAERAYIGADA